MEGVEVVPYRLPKVLAAETVYIVEGEKDVETLEALGVTATCNPMGAGKWRGEFGKFLRSKRVVIVPDNDTPGRKHALAVAASLLGVAATVVIAEIPAPAKDVTEFVEAGGSIEQIDALIAAAEPLTLAGLNAAKQRWSLSPSGQDAESELNEPSEKPAARLLRLADHIELFHTPDRRAYACIPRAGHIENWSLNSSEFEDWLTGEYYRSYRSAPRAQALSEALATLKARAQFDGEEHEVHVRVAQAGECIYIDLGNARWEAVEIDANGWRVVQQPPIKFRRPRGMAPLPTPQAGGSLKDLRRFINAPTDDLFVLVVSWLVGALNPAGPYPLLGLHGEQGSAKTTMANVLRLLTHPAGAGLRNIPSAERDLMIAADNNWVLVFDNLSGFSHATSDSLCRLATGGGFATRELYSDREESLFEAMRPVILNGIDDVAARQDLLDRSLVLSLPPIHDSKRQAQRPIYEAFEKARPFILGALYDAISMALRNLSSVSVPALPRMADFATWVVAAEPALPWKAGDFLKHYQSVRRQAIEVAIEGDSVAASVRKFMAVQPQWSGTATDLLLNLDAVVSDATRRSKDWPRNAQTLGNRLRRAATFLRATEIELDFRRSPGGHARIVNITRRAAVTTGTAVTSAAPSEADGLNVASVVTATPKSGSCNTAPAERCSPSGVGDARDGCDGIRAIPPTMSPNVSDEIDELLRCA